MKHFSKALLAVVLVGGTVAQVWEEKQDQRYFRECKGIDITFLEAIRVHRPPQGIALNPVDCG